MGEDSGGAVELYYMNAFGEKEHLTTVPRLGDLAPLLVDDDSINALLASRGIILAEATEDGDMTLAKVKRELEKIHAIVKDDPSIAQRYDSSAAVKNWREVKSAIERLLKNIKD